MLNTATIRQRVAELGEWFQNLDLKGVATAPHHFLGDYPRAKWRHVARALPARMDGLSVLDVGCNAGFHALECKRRGARQVVGIDADAHYLAQARLASSVLGLEIEWRQLSVYRLAELGRQFDYVFFLGVFYHLRYPLYALDLVAQAARQCVVFQTMLRGEASTSAIDPNYDFWDGTPFAQPGFPRLHFIEQAYAGDASNWWIPNRAAAEALLRSAGLAILAHPEEETWICAPAPPDPRGPIPQRELEGWP